MFNWLKKKNFIFIIGEETISFAHIIDNNIVHFISLDTKNVESFEKLHSIMANDKSARITILLDYNDQFIEERSFIILNQFSEEKIIKNKLENEYDSNFLVGYNSLNNVIEQNEHKFIYISAAKKKNLNHFLEIISFIPNPIEGIFSLNIEVGAWLNTIIKAFIPVPLNNSLYLKEKKLPHYQIFIADTGNQILKIYIAKDLKIFKVQMFELSASNNLASYLSGSIEFSLNEAQDVIKKLQNEAAYTIDVIILTSQDTKERFFETKIKANNFVILTSRELLNKLKVSVEQDIFLSNQFAMFSYLASISKKQVSLYDPELKKICFLQNFKKPLTFFTAGLVIILFSFLSISQSTAITNTKKLKQLDSEIHSGKKRLDELNALLINSDSSYYKSLSMEAKKIVKDNLYPFEILGKLKEIEYENISFKIIDWQRIENNKLNIHLVAEYGDTSEDFSSQINNFLNVKNIISQLELGLENYDIKYSNLSANRLNFFEGSKMMPIEINLSWPIDKESK